MDCKITSITKRRGKTAAYSLLELTIAVGIGFLALAAVAALALYTSRSFTAIGNYIELDKNSRNALDRLTQLVREADGITSYDNHSIFLSYHGAPLSFVYKPSSKILTMTDTNNFTKTLLTGCEYLEFKVFQRNPVPGTYDQYPATENESMAKLVQVSWICSKSLISSLLNSESVQSAKIVIRKQ